MKPGQVKCTECDSYRGWRRIYFGSSNTLTLLIALFSVIGLVVPMLMKACTANSNVGVRVIGYREPDEKSNVGVILVSAANSGRQPGLVQSVSLDLTHVYVKNVDDLAIENRSSALVSGEKESVLELNTSGLYLDGTHPWADVDKALCNPKTTLSLTAKVAERDWRGNTTVVDRKDSEFTANLIRTWVLKRLNSSWQESACPKANP